MTGELRVRQTRIGRMKAETSDWRTEKKLIPALSAAGASELSRTGASRGALATKPIERQRLDANGREFTRKLPRILFQLLLSTSHSRACGLTAPPGAELCASHAS